MIRYRAREGYWAWLLHRVSGVAILLFLFLHILDTALVGFGPEAYESFVFVYRLPVFRVMEVALAAAVLYHGINGLRIIVMDFVDEASRAQRQLWYVAWAVFLVLFVPTAFLMLRPVFFPSPVVGLVP
jgi:succinate dehydrogenase / fumarate reductase, cytochrome b subunit